MTSINTITSFLEEIAPLHLQESYDNAGLITGDPSWEVSQVLISLDVTEEVVQEAIDLGANIIVAHHPIVFRGLKRFNGSNYVERTVIKALKNDIAIYASHTNMDSVMTGVNRKICDRLNLQNPQILQPKDAEQKTGSGMIATLPTPMPGDSFLEHLKEKMQVTCIKHTALLQKNISRVAVCGGSGSFLLQPAIQQGADAFVTSDFKYHEFFDAESKLIICDIGHYESEVFTKDLFYTLLREKFVNIALNLSKINTNPISYFC